MKVCLPACPLAVMLCLIIPLPATPATDKCISVILPNITLCASGVIHQDLLSEHRACQRHVGVCRRGFNVSFIRLEPISDDTLQNIVHQLVHHCCGGCVNVTTLHHFKGMADISTESINTSHIVYPLLGEKDSKTMFGYHFLPFWDTPGAYYITVRRTKMAVVKRLIVSCVNFWPLLVVMVFTALISGFIVWLVETWVNKEMFPRTFLSGIFDGFWWSFISMTTVGYGDKVPTVFVSRIFSVLWILMGITICSMFTASLTTEVTDVTAPENHDLTGKPIGIVKQRLYDLALVAHHGGLITESEGVSLHADVVELIGKLRHELIDGFLLDKFAYSEILRYFADPQLPKNMSAEKYFFKNDLILTEKHIHGSKLSFGMLVKETEDFEYLKEFIVDNRITLQMCSNIALHRIDNKIQREGKIEEGNNIFSTDSGLFVPTVLTETVVITIIGIFGFVYEMRRRRRKRRKKETSFKETGDEAVPMTTL